MLRFFTPLRSTQNDMGAGCGVEILHSAALRSE